MTLFTRIEDHHKSPIHELSARPLILNTYIQQSKQRQIFPVKPPVYYNLQFCFVKPLHRLEQTTFI